jgi:allantoate deiminase
VVLKGETGHAGTLPMAARKDALVGAAALVSEVNRTAKSTADLRGTVGSMRVSPNMVNAVPSEVRMTVELRSPDDAIRERAGKNLHVFARKIADEHGLICKISRSYHQPAQPCDKALSQRLQEAVQSAGGEGMQLPSGATHDASAMADLCPIAMLFVRCREGLSHTPVEFAEKEDMAKAVEALRNFLKSMVY